MPQAFDAQNPPFDRLSHQEIEELRRVLDIGYFRPGEVIVEKEKPSENLHVIIKGSVEERDGDELEAVLGQKESFDARALVQGSAGASFVAAEETLCYLAPKQFVLDLIRRNAGFAAFFYSEISHKLASAIRFQETEGVDSVLRARVRDARRSDTNALFVRDGGRCGVVTGMNLSKAVVLDRAPLETKVRDICHFDVVAIDRDDFVFEALIKMTRHNKRRRAGRATGENVGVVGDIVIHGHVGGN